MTAGLFITLEGVEGAGKSTIARALKAELEQHGLPVLLNFMRGCPRCALA